MAIRLLTLDCANTLLEGAWDPVGFAMRSAEEAGIELPDHASESYGKLLGQFYPEILATNLTGDLDSVLAVYVRLGRGWLEEMQLDPDSAPSVVQTSVRLLTSKDGLFSPFDDTIPFLHKARAGGIRLAIVSNWDVTLGPVLRAHGLSDLVDETYASLVIGAEKPDPKMIEMAMASAMASPEETWHVGDDLIDDLGAAHNAGVRGVLLDRSLPSDPPRRVQSLLEVLDWIG